MATRSQPWKPRLGGHWQAISAVTLGAMCSTQDQRRAVVLVSGGLDSATVLAMAKAEGFVCTALSFDYQQRHRCELSRAAAVCQSLDIADHRTIVLDPTPFHGSTLTDGGAVSVEASGSHEAIPDTYVPARNTIFLSMALGMAEGIGATDIFIGATAVDYSGYPDCRPAFIQAFENLANLATKVGVEQGSFRIQAPLLDLSKAEIIQRGMALGVAYELTNSCYDPDPQGVPCHQCDSCVLRAKGFAEAGHPDPLLAATSSP